MSVNKQSLYEHVSWCVWHEGLRIYDNGFPGSLNSIDSIRHGCLRLQQHNDFARGIITEATNNELMKALYRIEHRVEDEHQLSEYFKWVAFHEVKLHDFIAFSAEGQYSEMRTIYYNHHNHNSNSKHLLSCVSNAYIAGLINVLSQ